MNFKHARRVTLGLATALGFASISTMSGMALPTQPSVPLAKNPVRSVEPVVMTGSQFPSWSGGPEATFHEPMSPLNSITVNQQKTEPALLQSDCFDANGANYGGGGPVDNGDHNCYQDSRLPVRTNPVTSGVDPRRILGYRWDGTVNNFVQIPFQVDQVFDRYLTNNASGFAFYSGVDRDTDYAYDREPFRWASNDPPADPSNPTSQVCWSKPYNNPHGGFYDGQATTPSPNGFHLIDKDELTFMAKDAGNAAPVGAKLPAGIVDAYSVLVTDPDNGDKGRIYVALAGANGPAPAYTAANSPYVHYQPDANAQMFVRSQSSYGGYGAAPAGWYCNADGTLARNANGTPAIAQRRPLDTAWVWTPNYAFRYEGRWMMTEIHVSNGGNGYVDANGGLHNYGPSIVDRWKARAFQQAPGGDTPCCGYEEEDTNWGGSSIMMGERTGPVRTIRATWGADSSTNNIRREIFYNQAIKYQDDLRVHVIPPLDGIYVQRDMTPGVIDTYYNPYQKKGSSVDGRNDEVFGNTYAGFGANGLCYSSDDRVGDTTGATSYGTPVTTGPGSDPCNNNDVHNSFDFFDPTFSGPPGALAWEQLTGDSGTLVERWGARTTSIGGMAAAAVTAYPYYRDDSCFDDGTGVSPGPKLHLRSGDEPQYWWLDPVTGVPTAPNYKTGNVNPPAGVTLNQRRCWNHYADGTPYPAGMSDPAPDPNFSPQGDIRYFQGDIGTHGLHVMFIADSDNAQGTVPVEELDSEQTQVILPGRQANVGEAYGRAFEKPLVATATPGGVLLSPAPGSPVPNVPVPAPPTAPTVGAVKLKAL
ncbi:MAG: hypothetical protein QOE92_429 [Chloroflexota bacterium]|nr:hypothetical protein [Chloroflexota bacterium]